MADAQSQTSGVANRYAAALFELALEAGTLDSVEADLTSVEALISSSPDFARLVRSPVFGADDQIAAISAVFEKAGIGGSVANFAKLTARNRRLFALPDMVRAFRALLAAHRGEATADVVSAESLSDTHVTALKDALKDVTGKDVQLNQSVDPTLLGGLVVRLGSRMIDTSLKTKLNALRIAMKEAG
ncbi:MAG: F0F1 ATP synthase subunit delta [Pseudomonadota bacterium]